jgi:hypothetical protein
VKNGIFHEKWGYQKKRKKWGILGGVFLEKIDDLAINM